MIRLGRMTDYGVVLLNALGETRWRSAATLVSDTGIPAPTTAKVLRRLTRAGLLESQRGAYGGYRLARSPEVLSVADVVRAMEGPIAITNCVAGARDPCHTASFCPMQGWWNHANRAVEVALSQVTLAGLRRGRAFGTDGTASTAIRPPSPPAPAHKEQSREGRAS